MKTLLANWLDHRTGARRLINALLLEHIPGGARWRYVWGSCLAFVFTIQLLTGVLLMTAYSPGDSTAWSSVYFIQYQMDFGWLIRGLHHFGSQTMVVLLGIHMLQVVIAGAQLPPREVNWWLGLGLLGLVLGLSLTGYLLPWDQKGYWATQVATNIAGNLPVLGPKLQKIVVGGPVYGHQTLTHFYALHVAVLPPLVIALIVAHLVVFRRHGVTVSDAARKDRPDGLFWPDQAFKDMVVSMLIFAIMLGLVLWGHGQALESPNQAGSDGGFYDRIAHAGREGKGANLDAPADPARPYPARPEWYFLFLFQLLKYFEGEQEIIGTVVIPTAAGLLLAVLPLLGHRRMRPFGHAVGVLVMVSLLAGAAALTYLAVAKDRGDSEDAKTFRKEQETADALAHRAVQLAGEGIPAEGAVYLLRRDPMTMGRELFKQHCATCHSRGNEFKNEHPTASDLDGFGTRDWVWGVLHEPESPHYFGRTHLTAMTNWVKRTTSGAHKDKEEKKLDEDLAVIADWLAGHPRIRRPEGEAPADPEKLPSDIRGFWTFENRCGSCHTYQGKGGGEVSAPDMTGYGDAAWLRLMLLSPANPQRYGARNTMPAFRDLEGPMADFHRLELDGLKDKLLQGVEEDKPEGKKRKTDVESATKVIQLGDAERELIIRFVLKDYRVVFGGDPISGPPRR